MSNPTNITVDTYNTIASQYTDTYFTDSSDFLHIEGFVSAISSKGSILEVGCGAGQFSQYLLSRGFSVIGIDLSDSMLSFAKEKVPEGVFQKMDMRALSFPSGIFDGIIAAYSLIHIPDSEVGETLRGFYRVLNPAAVICVIVQEGESDHMVDEPFAPGKQIFFNFFTPDRIRMHLEAAGFTSIEIQRVPCDDPYALANEILYIVAKKA